MEDGLFLDLKASIGTACQHNNYKFFGSVRQDRVNDDANGDPELIVVVISAVITHERQEVEEGGHSILRWQEDAQCIEDEKEDHAEEEQ